MIAIKVGQVWEVDIPINNKSSWNPLPLPPNFTMRLQYAGMAFEITEVIKDVSTVKAICIKDREGTFGYGKEGVFNNINYSSHWRLIKDVKDTEQISDQLSNCCKKCKEYFPYVEATVNFECWACRNGANP